MSALMPEFKHDLQLLTVHLNGLLWGGFDPDNGASHAGMQWEPHPIIRPVVRRLLKAISEEQEVANWVPGRGYPPEANEPFGKQGKWHHVCEILEYRLSEMHRDMTFPSAEHPTSLPTGSWLIAGLMNVAADKWTTVWPELWPEGDRLWWQMKPYRPDL